MRILILMALLSTNAIAAKPLDPSDPPFTYTVEAYVPEKVGKDLQWHKKDTYQSTAHQYFNEHVYLFEADSVARFLIEWPRNGYDSFNIYGCIDANKTMVLHNSNVCGYDEHDQIILERVRVRKLENKRD